MPGAFNRGDFEAIILDDDAQNSRFKVPDPNRLPDGRSSHRTSYNHKRLSLALQIELSSRRSRQGRSPTCQGIKCHPGPTGRLVGHLRVRLRSNAIVISRTKLRVNSFVLFSSTKIRNGFGFGFRRIKINGRDFNATKIPNTVGNRRNRCQELWHF